ncbi:MAG TPA: hypothetical protein VGQ37_08830 [Vicinamibacterales bacterium]|jgi:hypothetical protein|nr:hypothetical protein [Vicinamibacterales bacterium]
MKAHILLASVLVMLAALPAAGQSVKLSFHGGKVDLSAENASVRAILTEWARVGGTSVVNAERIVGPPVTVEFKDAYEQQALESLLRGVSGYIVGPRLAPGTPTSSGFDRIVILATSTTPRPTPVTPVVSRPPGPQPLRRLPGPVEDTQDDPNDNDPAVATANAGPRPETPADLRRRLGQLLEADADDDKDNPPAPATTPSNPFGVTTGAARPGVITPVPAPRTAPRPTPDPSTQP